MCSYKIRKALADDIEKIVAIYQSNKLFLVKHLGDQIVDASFIKEEMIAMKQAGFLSCVIVEPHHDEVIGVIDYQMGPQVYLSLMMLDKSYQGCGIGDKLYAYFEAQMQKMHQTVIRIDVVNDYPEHIVGFWEREGFVYQEDITLEWGKKKSKAIVMTKTLPHGQGSKG